MEQILRCNPEPSEYKGLQVLETTDGLNIFHIAVNMTSKDILRQVATNVPGKDGMHNHVLSGNLDLEPRLYSIQYSLIIHVCQY